MKTKSLAAALAFFLGGLGIHKFYLGRPGQGILYALFCWTLIPAILGFLEAIVYISMSQEQFDAKYNADTRATSVSRPSVIKEKLDGSTVAICPFCAEEIKLEAIKCKHCGSLVHSQANTPVSSPKPSTDGSSNVFKILIVVILLGLIMSGVLSILHDERTRTELNQGVYGKTIVYNG